MAQAANGSYLGKLRGPGLPVIGMVRERQLLATAINGREHLLVLGPAGSGKTTLVQSLPAPEHTAETPIYISRWESPRDLLVLITRALLQSGHRLATQHPISASGYEQWLKHKTSVSLRGILWTSLEARPRTLILDGVNKAGPQVYRFLQRLYFAPGMALIATARDQLQLGDLGKLFWDPRKTLHLAPLSEAEALQLFEVAADHFGLRHLYLEEFRDRVLECAAGNPGQIVEMCRLAGRPEYIAGKYIKFALIRIDALMHCL